MIPSLSFHQLLRVIEQKTRVRDGVCHQYRNPVDVTLNEVIKYM